MVSDPRQRTRRKSAPNLVWKTYHHGFTIVEMMIVLAIAGLILLIVFEAIPALERSSRNNNRKQDVANILQAVSHYELNHSGTFPSPSLVASCTLLQYTKNSLRYYDCSNVSLTALASGAANKGPSADPNTVQIYNYELCNSGTTGQATSNGAGYADVVAIYAIENSSSGTTGAGQCQQL